MPDSTTANATSLVPKLPMPEARLRVHLLSHTHWDREWYHTAGRFQQRLVPLIDTLLARSPVGASPFLLDGQAILLADYLSVRPQAEPALREHLAAGVLEAGPWYVLADNLIPSGEAIVRNLHAGARLLARLGAHPPRVAYCPDTFGHPAMMPAIAAGFGCESAVVWRGLGGAMHPARNTLWWRSPDGSRLLVHHLPPDGYEVGSALPVDPEKARERWNRLADHWRARPGTNVVLLPNGADHHALQPDRDAAVASLTAAAQQDDAVVTNSTLGAFADALVESARAHSLPSVHGELRDSYGYTWTLQGTFGTRAAQKRENARLERALLRDVEPWLALAWLHERKSSPSTAATVCDSALPALLARTWEALLRTHPHDTLCGCSSDEVSLAMEQRQRAVRAMLPGLRELALQHALGHDPVVARARPVLDAPPVVIRNCSGRARGGIAEVRLLETVGDVRVGPGSASSALPRAAVAAPAPTLYDLPTQAGRTALSHERRESPQHYPDDDLVRAHRVLAWVPPVPAHGVLVLSDEVGRTLRTEHPVPRDVSLHVGGATVVLDNGIVRVECGRFGVRVHKGDRMLPHALSLESTTDAGDSYTASLRGASRVLRLVRVTPAAKGPLRASVQLRWVLDDNPQGDAAIADVPSEIESMTVDRAPHHARNGRVIVLTTLVLDAGSDLLRCDVRGVNGRTDHRLRLCWHSDITGTKAAIWADAAFGPVPREVICVSNDAARLERPPLTMPMHRWVTMSTEGRGVTLLSDGLAEVEATNGTFSLTLMRAIGELSRADLPERPGHAGWPCATPRSQSRGAFRARVALLLHDAWSDDTVTQIEDAADQLLLPLRGETWRDLRVANEKATQAIAGAELGGRGLRASAVTLSADAHSLLLRAINVTDSTVDGEWRLPDVGPWTATRCRLDETPLDDAQVLTSSSLRFSAPPRALVTFLVRRA